MDWATDAASKHQFEGFAAEASDSLLRTGYLMTGDVRDAEDLFEETFLRVARRWNRVRSMDHPAAYARRILINLVLDDAGRRSRQQAELAPQDAGTMPPTRARCGRSGKLMTSRSSAGRWLSCLRGSVPCWCAALLGKDPPVAEVADVLGCSAATVTSTASRAAARLAQTLTRSGLPSTGPTTRPS